jgi:hypothetical protein
LANGLEEFIEIKLPLLRRQADDRHTWTLASPGECRVLAQAAVARLWAIESHLLAGADGLTFPRIPQRVKLEHLH